MVALELRAGCPPTLAALQAGDIAYLQAAHLAAAVRELPDQEATAVQARVLGRAPEQTLAEFKRAVRRAVLAADPASAADRHQQGGRGPHHRGDAAAGRHAVVLDDHAGHRRERRVGHPDHPGQGHPGSCCGPAPGTTPAWTRCGSTPWSTPSSAPTHANTTRPTGPAGRLPRCSCGGAQTAAVVLDLPTLLGLADNPGEIPGYGPIPAPLARQMAGDRDWVRWTTDPATGQLLDRGANTYRPSDKLRRSSPPGTGSAASPAATARAQHATATTSSPSPTTAETIRVNLGPLCRQHHNAKTHGLWQLSYDPDTGTKTWTSPLGKTYTKGTDPVLG